MYLSILDFGILGNIVLAQIMNQGWKFIFKMV